MSPPWFTACGDSSQENNSAPEIGDNPAPDDLGESFDMLGIDTTITDRLDSQGNPYPETYAPMGDIIYVRELPPVETEATAAASGSFKASAASDEPTYVLGRREELFLGGVRLKSRNFVFSSIDDISIAGLTDVQARILEPEPADGSPPADNGVIRVLEGRTSPGSWAQETGEYFDSNGQRLSINQKVVLGTRRDATAADINGDGFQDAIVAYVANTDAMNLQIIDGDDSTDVLDISLLIGGEFLPAYDVQIASGDFDGDGIDELAIVIARQPTDELFDTPVGLYIVDDAAANFAIVDVYDLTPPASFDNQYITLEIDSYHADHDDKDEIVIVVNESQRYAQGPGNYASRFFVFGLSDDGLQELAAGPITAEVIDTEGTIRTATAVVASVVTEDIDDDSLDELIFAGLEEVIENCKGDFVDDMFVKYVLFAYGGKYNDFQPIRAGASEIATPQCSYESGASTFVMRYVHLNILDFDGDGDMDIQLNNLLLDSLLPNDWANNLLAEIPQNSFFFGGGSKFNDRRSRLDRSDGVITVSDQTGDGIKDIILLNMARENAGQDIRVFSWDATINDAVLATRFEIEQQDVLDYVNAILLPMDVDNDEVALYRYTGEYYLDFTEPTVLAAIAAAPCRRDIGQDSCSSSWGSSQSGALGNAFSVKVSASIGGGFGGTVGVGVNVTKKYLAKIGASAKGETSTTYELSKSQTFTTGPFEDGVVFTAVPVDRYTYEAIKDNTDNPVQIGDRIEIRLPRTPYLRIVERDYYNSSITADSEQIDDRVFAHVPGDVSSYPTANEKDVTLRDQRQIVEDSRFRSNSTVRGPLLPLPAERGLEVGPVFVGEGGGSTELGLEYTETLGASTQLAMSFSIESETLSGAAISWSVGIESERTFSISHGDSTLFSGSVDSIAAESYQDNLYAFGLFAYLQVLGDQEIEIINFWVEEN